MTEHEQELIKLICEAIQSKRLIRFWYENPKGTRRKEWRMVEPYIIGAFPQRNIQLNAWLLPTPEQALSGQQEVWRSYTLKNMSEVQLLATSFVPRRDYDPKASGMAKLICAAEKEVQFLKIV